MSVSHIVEREYEENKRQRFLDFVFHDPENDDYAPYIYNRNRANRCILADFTHDKYGLGKERPFQFPKSEQEKPAKTVKKEISPQTLIIPSEDIVCVCNVDMQTVKEFINAHHWRCKISQYCRSCRYAVSLEGILVDLIFWQKGRISIENNSVFECS